MQPLLTGVAANRQERGLRRPVWGSGGRPRWLTRSEASDELRAHLHLARARLARAKHPIAGRLAERVDGAPLHGTVRAADHAALRDQNETPVRS